MSNLFPLQMVREKSKMFQVPYEHLLIGCAKERVLERYLASSYGKESESCVFSHVVDMGIERYRVSKNKTIGMKVLEDELTENILSEIEKAFLGEGKDAWKCTWIKKENTSATLEIGVPFDKINLPVAVEVSTSPAKKGVLQRVSLPLCYENDRYMDVPCFFPEAELAEAFVEFWERLELIKDLGDLEHLYLMGKTFSLDGRRLSEYLELSFKDRGISFSKERCKQVFACEKNAHLKKRWKAYLSKEKRNTPEWEEVIKLIQNLYEPVILMLCDEEIFFGDWLPAVGRYL